jgi:hypothetical protein
MLGLHAKCKTIQVSHGLVCNEFKHSSSQDVLVVEMYTSKGLLITLAFCF